MNTNSIIIIIIIKGTNLPRGSCLKQLGVFLGVVLTATARKTLVFFEDSYFGK